MMNGLEFIEAADDLAEVAARLGKLSCAFADANLELAAELAESAKLAADISKDLASQAGAGPTRGGAA